MCFLIGAHRVHQAFPGTLLGLVAVTALVLLFAPPSTRWMAQDYGVEPEVIRAASRSAARHSWSACLVVSGSR